MVEDLRVPCECRVRMTPDFYSDKLKSGSAVGRAFLFLASFLFAGADLLSRQRILVSLFCYDSTTKAE